jgi:hypothetical protein
LCGVLSRINKSMLADEVPLAREQRKLAAILPTLSATFA